MAEPEIFYLPVTGTKTGLFAQTGEGYPADGHKGLDLACPIGSPVIEVYPSKVEALHTVGDGWGDGSLGNCVVTDWVGTPYYAFYAHLQSIDPALQVGGAVTRGQAIGKVGLTGRTSGPHLHFALCLNTGHSGVLGAFVDPLLFLKVNNEPAPPSLESRVALLENLVAGYGLIGPGSDKVNLFGQAALNYAKERQYSALAGVQLAGVKDAEIVKQVLLLAANSSASLKDDLISGLTDLLAKLERK